MSLACGSCARIASRDAGTAPLWDSAYRSDCWDVVHSYDTSLLGWLVLIPRRHIERVSDLNAAETQELGALLRTTSVFLQRHTNCLKTYVMQFAEHPQHPHVHFHVVPRAPELPAEARGAGIFQLLGVTDEVRVSEPAMNQLPQALRAFLEAELSG